MAQRTVGNYLRPSLRLEGSKGKSPSANLAQLEKIAEALNVEVWELLKPMTPSERVIHRKVEEAFAELRELTMRTDPLDPRPSHQVHEDPTKRYRA
jgi:hypothetical protein